MDIQSIELKDYRNYQFLDLKLNPGINIFYGNNAQGKTNLLEALYVGCTSKSHKASKDRELIRFGSDEAHIKLNLDKKDITYRIDIHIKKNRSKGIALNGIPLQRASQLFGIANIVIFSPEDLGIIKNGPSERRRFMDLELCQLNRIYTHDLIAYNKIINQKNKLLKDNISSSSFSDILDVYNEQLLKYGTKIIEIRSDFVKKLGNVMQDIHGEISKFNEKLILSYECNTDIENFEKNLKKYRNQEIKQRVSLVGPHRDDLCFMINDTDIRHFGSQGQQRTAALSLKLSEISLIEQIINDKPVLLLDDVLSELDRTRQNTLLNSIKDIQTVITCTGLDDLVNHRFHMDKIFFVKDGTITGEN